MSEPPAPAPENHWEAGRRGEEHALRLLMGKGYHLLVRNYRPAGPARAGRGEIDLVMEDPRGTLVFVEVKANRTQGAGRPLERIDGRKVRRLQRLAQRFCWERRCEERDMRFDVVGVDLQDPAGTEHIEGAFLPDTQGYYR